MWSKSWEKRRKQWLRNLRLQGEKFLDDDFLIEMIESLMLEEFKEKDYIIFEQQILERDISPPELEIQLERVLEAKSDSLKEKLKMFLKQNRLDLLERAFKRAQKRYKTKMTMLYMHSEFYEVGE